MRREAPEPGLRGSGLASLAGASGPDDERALRGHLRDVVALLALPAMWRDRAPEHIAASLLDVLVSMLRLDLAYVRLNDPSGGPALAEWRPAAPSLPPDLAARLESDLPSGEPSWTATLAGVAGHGVVRLTAVSPGLLGDRGILVAGSRRADFPTESESYLLRVAVDQAVLAIHSARLLVSEQAARAHAEAAQRRYHALVDSVDAIVWEADARTFQFTFVSKQAERVLGYPVERWLTESHFWADHIHPDDRAQAVAYCLTCTAAKEDHEFVYRVLAADGRVVWLRDIVKVIVDEQGEPARLRGVMVDVTQNKRAEVLLAHQKRALELIVAGAPLEETLELLTHLVEEQSEDGSLASILLLDRDGTHLRHGAAPSLPDSYNRAIDGIAIGPAVGSCGTAAYRGAPVVVADIASDPLWADFRDLALQHGLRACWSTPILASDGRVLGTFAIYYTTAREPSAHGRALVDVVTRTAAIAIERQRAEAAVREGQEQLREEAHTIKTISRVGQTLAAELDHDKLVQAVTDAATELAGAEFGAFFYNVVSEDENAYRLHTLSGAPREAFAQFPLPRNTAVFEPTFRGEGVVRLDDVTQDPRYGQNPSHHGMPPGHLPVRSYLAVPVVSRSGDVLGGLFFGHSQPGMFTERAEQLVVGIAAQAAIAMDNARLYQQAQQAIEGRNAFLAAASHDLKNPLAVIKARAQILRRLLTRPNPAPERLAESLDGITTTVARMTALIDTLLDVARLQSGQPLPLDPQETDLVALARQVVAEQGATSEQHQVRVETPLPSLVGRWDAPRLQRVLTNLLDNAIKYSPDGGAIVVRVAHDQQADTPWAVLAVEDSGIGIPAADLSRIFEQFQRGGNVRGELGGTGVGLATVRWIVTEHQGTVAIESQERVGTTVTVRLPLAPDKSRSPDELPAQ